MLSKFAIFRANLEDILNAQNLDCPKFYSITKSSSPSFAIHQLFLVLPRSVQQFTKI